jgi:hypothetical protein
MYRAAKSITMVARGKLQHTSACARKGLLTCKRWSKEQLNPELLAAVVGHLVE